MRKLADSYTIRPLSDSRAIGIMTDLNEWNEQILRGALALGRAYAPAVLVIDISNDMGRYVVSGEGIDLPWLRQSASRFEAGWELKDGVLTSPGCSQIEAKQMMELMVSALYPPAVAAVQQPQPSLRWWKPALEQARRLQNRLEQSPLLTRLKLYTKRL